MSIHLTRNGSHVDAKTICGLRATSELNPIWIEASLKLWRGVAPGFTVDRVCAECFAGAGVEPWPADYRPAPLVDNTPRQLDLLGGAA